MKYIPQYVNYNLLAHFLFLTSSYVLVSVLYNNLTKFEKFQIDQSKGYLLVPKTRIRCRSQRTKIVIVKKSSIISWARGTIFFKVKKRAIFHTKCPIFYLHIYIYEDHDLKNDLRFSVSLLVLKLWSILFYFSNFDFCFDFKGPIFL